MNIAVIGLSHKTAPVEVREKLSIPEQKIEGAIAQLRGYPHILEVAILSTCNRLEIYIVTSESEPGVREVMQFLSECSKVPLQSLRPHLFILLHEDAVMHLMRVASGLDGRILERLFKQALTAGKRVRTETSIGTGAVSISSAAAELAQLKGQHLATSRIAIIGAGKMSRLLVQHLLSKGASHIAIVNRSMRGAEELAGLFKDATLHLHLLSDMMQVIADSDLVFTSTAATDPLLNKAKLEAVLKPDRPLMLVDISVPRNVDSDAKEVANVKSFNVDDLKAVVAQNHESRRKMAMEAEGLLEQEVEAFDVWWRSLETVPTISCLRDKIELIREQELEKALSRLGSEFSEKHQDVIESLTRGIVNKILHDPMVQLRAQQDIEARRQAMQTLQTLFNLDVDVNQQYS
ncbi:MAG: glutamyl-tRNA reductase [Oscillatoriales cyanobacterium]|nr:MAG: glutamyl-tRNA reductase [Oscillatoriales cyanobacterium]